MQRKGPLRTEGPFDLFIDVYMRIKCISKSAYSHCRLFFIAATSRGKIHGFALQIKKRFGDRPPKKHSRRIVIASIK